MNADMLITISSNGIYVDDYSHLKCYASLKRKRNSMVYLIIFVIMIFTLYFYTKSKDFKRFKVSWTREMDKQIENDITGPIGHMCFMSGVKIKKNKYRFYSDTSRIVHTLLIEAIKVKQITISEYDEIKNNIFRFQIKFKEIEASSIKEVDRKELLNMFGAKFEEFLNSLIENLEIKIKNADTSDEKERLKKQIEKL